MTEDLHSKFQAALLQQALANGGYQSSAAAGYRSDATAWAILALQAACLGPGALKSARLRLAQDQLIDGRISISPRHPDAYWPTPLCILAWNQDPDFQAAREKACQFLLSTTGSHFAKESDSPLGHDPALKGWPWIDHTHSWVMPTSLSVLALKAAAYGRHDRVREAQHLLLDRQLSSGGWNYGNTTVFGQTLHPTPESTGVALSALAGSPIRPEVASSLTYLRTRLAQVQTPFSLSWGLLGLSAWGERPPDAAQRLRDCWQGQERYGPYGTEAISLLLLALTAPAGILSLLGRKSDNAFGNDVKNLSSRLTGL